MVFLPIVDRELRVAARRPLTHGIRFAVAGVTITVWGIFMMGMPERTIWTVKGLILFHAMATPVFALCLLSGLYLTADCLSAEKREGTLGLLFLTDLRGHDVVWGKLAASSIHAVFGVLAALPAMGLSLLIGGVTGGEFLRVSLVLAVTLLLSLSAGMAVSAVVREVRHALGGTLGILALLAGGLPAIYWLQRIFVGVPFGGLLLLPSPGYAYLTALDSHYASGRGGVRFWISLTVILVLALGLLGIACRVLPRKYCEECPSEPRPRSWQQASRRGVSARAQAARSREASMIRESCVGTMNPVAQPSPAAGSGGVPPLDGSTSETLAELAGATPALHYGGSWKEGMTDLNPFDRVVGGFRLFRTANWLAGGILVLWFLGFVGVFVNQRWQVATFTIVIGTSYALHFLFKCLYAAEACRRFSEDRASGALELLLTTPLSPQAMITAQMRALRRQFAGLLKALLVVNLAMVWQLLGPDPMRMGRGDSGIFSLIFLSGMLLLIADAWALGWQGMLQGLRGYRHLRATVATMVRVLVPFWVAIFVFVMMSVARMIPNEDTVRTLVIVWVLAALGTDWVLGMTAWTRLSRHFRAVASSVPDREPSRLRRPEVSSASATAFSR